MLLVLNVSGFWKTSMVVSNTAKPSVHECICICTQSWSKQRFLGLGTFLGCSGKRWIESIESKFLQNQNVQPKRSKRSISASIRPLQLLYSPFIFYTKKLPKTQTLRTSFNSAFSCFRRATSIRSCSILGFPAIFSWVEYLGKLWIISRYPAW